ncbi:alpha/beta hydrolase [Natronosporangium hydrolyticum]|uniref:Alpha/beta hydrolase n=1 Tax=Natronosporangium hydrolyticum TaxID=2811111 RepID=A0A895YK68_9ACTN|nr:alpha/beta hydrolase [Natronosporangium hydrolyticum]QSB14218.1 alpha/beta hydrolase [Natronosporangium hydrolyticum]
MVENRIHRAISNDGTEIAGSVHGDGPPLVLVHGACADEDEWSSVAKLLADRFTCYSMSTRGRGASGSNPDLSTSRLIEDVTAFVDSVGAPVRLAGVSGGGMLALGAAARSSQIAAVVTWEAVVIEVLPDEVAGTFQKVLARMHELHAAGQYTEGVRTFLGFIGNEHEMVTLAAADEFARAADYFPVDLKEIDQALVSDEPSPTDPAALAKITAPVLLMYGTASKQLDWFAAGCRFAAEHLPAAQVRTVADVGHLACQVAPATIASELRDFFTTA